MIKSKIKEITIKGRKVKYCLTRKNVKNINMRIKDDMMVHISANNYVSVKELEAVLFKNREFIFSALDKAAKRLENEPIENEIMYMGKKYKKCIIKSDLEKCSIDGDKFIIEVRDTSDEEKIKKITEDWHNKKAKELFGEINDMTAEIFSHFGIPKAEIKVRKMVSRWGRCSVNEGRIRINRYLTEFPRACAEYVFVHEYTHFIYRGHGKDFYGFVSKIFPDYKNIEKYLDTYGNLRNRKN